MSRRGDEWGTPEELFIRISKTFGPFELDPCTTADNPLGLPIFYTAADNGLSKPWSRPAFINPPFSSLFRFTFKAAVDARLYEVRHVALIPASRETHWWRANIRDEHAMVLDLSKRVRYVGADSGARFASAVVIWPGSMEDWCK